jgi:hypothetical protein
MPKLKIERLREGMVVAVDVQNMDQMLLLPAGCVLAEKHIGILEAWGVTDVEVVAADDSADDGDPLAKLPPEELARLTAETKARFWQLDETSPVPMEIFQLILRRAARSGVPDRTQP